MDGSIPTQTLLFCKDNHDAALTKLHACLYAHVHTCLISPACIHKHPYASLYIHPADTYSGRHASLIYIFECIHRTSNNYFCTLASCEHKSLYVYTYTLQYTYTQGHTLYTSCFAGGTRAYQGAWLKKEVRKFKKGIGSGKPTWSEKIKDSREPALLSRKIAFKSSFHWWGELWVCGSSLSPAVLIHPQLSPALPAL